MLSKIAQLSRCLGRITTGALVALPLMLLWRVSQALIDPETLRARFADLPAVTALAPGKAAAVAALGLLALGPAMAALWRMRALFARYGAGEILTPAAADLIRGIGAALVLMALAMTLLHTAQMALLTIDSPDGQKILSIRLDSDALGFLLSGGLLIVIGWVMREAARAAEDAAGFV